jgi:hypothetical protein
MGRRGPSRGKIPDPLATIGRRTLDTLQFSREENLIPTSHSDPRINSSNYDKGARVRRSRSRSRSRSSSCPGFIGPPGKVSPKWPAILRWSGAEGRCSEFLATAFRGPRTVVRGAAPAAECVTSDDQRSWGVGDGPPATRTALRHRHAPVGSALGLVLAVGLGWGRGTAWRGLGWLGPARGWRRRCEGASGLGLGFGFGFGCRSRSRSRSGSGPGPRPGSGVSAKQEIRKGVCNWGLSADCSKPPRQLAISPSRPRALAPELATHSSAWPPILSSARPMTPVRRADDPEENAADSATLRSEVR